MPIPSLLEPQILEDPAGQRHRRSTNDLHSPMKSSFKAVSIELSGGPVGNTSGAFHCQQTKISLRYLLSLLSTHKEEMSREQEMSKEAPASGPWPMLFLCIEHSTPHPSSGLLLFSIQVSAYILFLQRGPFHLLLCSMLFLYLLYAFQSINPV